MSTYTKGSSTDPFINTLLFNCIFELCPGKNFVILSFLFIGGSFPPQPQAQNLNSRFIIIPYNILNYKKRSEITPNS